MPEYDQPWNCGEAAECLTFVARELARRGLITGWVGADDVASILRRCRPCTRRRNPNQCMGWELDFGDSKPLRFTPVNLKEREISVTVTGRFSFQRTHRDRWEDWKRQPMRECNLAIFLRDVRDNKPLTRQHLELASNDGSSLQHGPVWHLQLGGVPLKGVLGRLEVPRWPSAPLDFMLLVDLVLFTFWFDHWKELRRQASWRRWVKRSEVLVLGHYHEWMNSYWTNPERHDSWLAAQCNQTSGWNPRPP
jgi:hypothetical protein